MAKLQKENDLGKHQDFYMYANAVHKAPAFYRSLESVFNVLKSSHDSLLKETVLVEHFLLCQQFENIKSPVLKRNHRLQHALDFMVEHHQREVSLSDICDAMHLSRSYLIRAFKQNFGITPHAFLLNQRVLSAQKQLKQGKKIAQVAHEFGFADQPHFQRIFKRLVAATPKQYINALPLNTTHKQPIKLLSHN